MEQFFQQLTNGLAVGGIYALIALGYTSNVRLRNCMETMGKKIA